MQAEEIPSSRSTLQLVRSVASDTEELIRKEIELAKHEISEGLTHRARTLGALAVAGMLAMIGILFGALAAADALRDAGMTEWGARLVVGGAFVGLALIGLLMGVGRTGASIAPQKATGMMKDTLRGELQWAKAQLKP